MLTNPRTSLALVQSILQRFSDVYYYNVNASKFHILDLGLNGTTRNLLSNSYPFQWAESGISYLGISLTKSTKGLFKDNFIPFRQKFTSPLSKPY